MHQYWVFNTLATLNMKIYISYFTKCVAMTLLMIYVQWKVYKDQLYLL